MRLSATSTMKFPALPQHSKWLCAWLATEWQPDLPRRFALHRTRASTNQSGNGENADRPNLVADVSPFAGVSHSIVNGTVNVEQNSFRRPPPPGRYGAASCVFGETQATRTWISPFSKIRTSLKKSRFSCRVAGVQPVQPHQIGAGCGFPFATGTGWAVVSSIGAYFAAPGIGH